MAEPSDRLTSAIRALLGELLPNYLYLGFHRYSVTSSNYDEQTADLQPSVSASGLPVLSKIPIRSNVKVELVAGSSVIVGFAGGNPSDPFIAFLDQSTALVRAKLRASGQIDIGEAATLPAARQGDMVLSAGTGTQIMVSVSPSGDQNPAPVMTMTPLYVSFGSVSSVPPTFPLVGMLTGIVSSGSALVNEA
jgi:hypothetical protein